MIPPVWKESRESMEIDETERDRAIMLLATQCPVIKYVATIAIAATTTGGWRRVSRRDSSSVKPPQLAYPSFAMYTYLQRFFCRRFWSSLSAGKMLVERKKTRPLLEGREEEP